MPISILDARSEGGRIVWSPAILPERDAAHRLLRAFRSQVQEVTGAAGLWALERTAAVIARVPRLPHRAELREVARALGVPEGRLLLANLAYELTNAAGCSSFIRDDPRGPLHARNLDWDFPGRLLRDHATVVRVSGAPLGDYALVTWPGFLGALTAVAPGRFSVAVNYVRHASHSGPLRLMLGAASGGWPVAWAVRRALDEGRDFAGAVDLLGAIPLLAPVLFSVAGTRSGEGAVIERTPDRQAHRPLEGASACVTNHYLVEANRSGNVDLSAQDTIERLAALEAAQAGGGVAEPGDALRLLSSPALLREKTQVQVAMRPAEGMLAVQVPGGAAVQVSLERRSRNRRGPDRGPTRP